ncbi:MAG: ORF6N domain-containing protein [Candidatus Omnitrophica bacterium]|nr:ORF6N domain-containing protein [Candidatus Omnitrophota bacterium]
MSAALVPSEIIENKILLVRGKKVLLDSSLAQLYGVPTKSLNLAVRRNIARFPEDFPDFVNWTPQIMRIHA